jgi:hypothetical protein
MDKIVFDGDFSKESEESGIETPFKIFAPGHFGFTSSLDIEPPPGYAVRLESHPKLYTDPYNQTPLVVPGHIQGEWWPKIFFVVFKAPAPGQEYVFRKNEPYAQILIVPKKASYEVIEMTEEEKQRRYKLDEKVSKYGPQISEHGFKDNTGQDFNDKYKVLKRAFSKDGLRAIEELFQKTEIEDEQRKAEEAEAARKRFGRRVLGLKK